MEEKKSILHELYVFSEWKPEPEYLQKPDNILPENLTGLWRWLNFFGPKKSLIDRITAFKERQQKWHIALGNEGKVIAILADNILEIRTKRSEYATITARTTVSRDPYPQWRKLVWSPDCSFVVLAYGSGVISFFDLTASNLFNIPADCSRPGGLECTDNTHAVADIMFMPLRVKDTKWNWEVLVVTFDGKLRGYLASQSEGFTLHHAFRFGGPGGGVASVQHCPAHNTLYVAGVPLPGCKEPSSPVNAGLSAWRILNDDPFYKLSVVSEQLETQLATDRFHMYIPFMSTKNLAFIVHMVLSPDGSKLVCLHCNGDVSVWRLPALKLLSRFPLLAQPMHDLDNPLEPPRQRREEAAYYAADVNWWTNEEVILSRFSGAVSVCDIKDMVNILGKKPEFFQGTPRVTCALDGTFMVLECETSIVPPKKPRESEDRNGEESMEVSAVEPDENSLMELTKELIKTFLFAITDIETFQPRPKRITVVSRVYRLLGVKSTTPDELFNRKIESGNYSEALALADTFALDSDLVYQQQWRKNPVSADTIQKYLSKVSKKIWAVHQCVDRLPETLPAAKELLQFGLQLTNEQILSEINKDRDEDEIQDPQDITLEDLNAYTSELLRCRHVMLFYKERLRLYEAILRCEKSTYVKDEYARLRSSSILHSAVEVAKEGRVEALTCLWPHLKTLKMQLTVLGNLPETLNPIDYQHLLPVRQPVQWFDKKSPIKLLPDEHKDDWCRKDIFRSIWNSNWSEEPTPEGEKSSNWSEESMPEAGDSAETTEIEEITKWYEDRAKEIEERSGLVSHALTLVTIASVGGDIPGLEKTMFFLLTLDTLVYDCNIERITLKELEDKSVLDTCKCLMEISSPTTFVADLKQYVIPFLKRYEKLSNEPNACHVHLTNYLENVSVDDLSFILLVLQSPSDFELDVCTHLELAEKCLFAYTGTDQLDKACDLLKTLLRESDGSISHTQLVLRVREIEKLVSASSKISWRGVLVPPRKLREVHKDPKHAHHLLTRVARNLSTGPVKPTQSDWEKLLKDIMELQTTCFSCITKEECYEIYASALLTSGDVASIKLASEALTCDATARRSPHAVNYNRSVELVYTASREYFNSASSLTDPALDMAKACLTLIKDDNKYIKEELDLIAALQILSEFELTILPIQVRICEDRMSLVEECLKSSPTGYLASHKLLKLAKLLRINGDDEISRESAVLVRVGEAALAAGPLGLAAATAAARRLAALRCSTAATLLARVAATAHAHADRDARRQLFAAAAAHIPPEGIEDILKARLALELSGLQELGMMGMDERSASVDDEFVDAVTTPVIEKKDLVPPSQSEKLPIFNYLLDTFQNKFGQSEKSATVDVTEKTVHCQEFYKTLYPEHQTSEAHYRYDAFATPAAERGARGQNALKWYYIQNCIENGGESELDAEAEVVQKCAEEILYKDTPLSVACMLRSTQAFAETKQFIASHNTDTAVSAALYATLVRCNAPELRDNVYLSVPSKMARTTLKFKNASEEQMQIIRQCIDKLAGMGEVDSLRRLGFQVNGLLFNADEDYRREVIYRVARSDSKQHLEAAVALAVKYGMDALEVWLQHSVVANLTLENMPKGDELQVAHKRVSEALWPKIEGNDHNQLISYFTLLKNLDEKPLILGMSAADHIKLLKKVKAVSQELDYKMLLEQRSIDEFGNHMLQIIKPENVGMLTKLLRTLPPVFKLPLPVNTLYTMWLTRYFFSVPPSAATNKKWMQQYRQCASYFNKLSKEDLLNFVANTCFNREAIDRVPAGTRNLMIMQAVDYCHQEQENDFKFIKGEPTWGQVSQELTRWARFLENYYSSTIQGIIDTSGVPHDEIWPEIEMSHGDPEIIIACASRLVMKGDMRVQALMTVLQCLNVHAAPVTVFHYTIDFAVHTADDIQTFVKRLVQYHKDGVKFSEELIQRTMQRATDFGLPPHKQISLLSLSQKTHIHDSSDLVKIAQFTADLLRTEWSNSKYAKELTDNKLVTEAGRREVFGQFLAMCDTWQKRKALVDVLVCWPTTRDGASRSLHCEYTQQLLSDDGDHREKLVLIKLLLRRPVLDEEEVQHLVDTAPPRAALNAVWVVLLTKFENSKENIVKLLEKHKDTIQNQEIEDDLIKELLESDMFLKLVGTVLYTPVINFIMTLDAAGGEPNSDFNLRWATNELVNANFLAEAGHLQLLAKGVPAALRGFSESVNYFKRMFQ